MVCFSARFKEKLDTCTCLYRVRAPDMNGNVAIPSMDVFTCRLIGKSSSMLAQNAEQQRALRTETPCACMLVQGVLDA